MKKATILIITGLFLAGCVKSKEVKYTYCPDPNPIPDCVKFGDIESTCFQKWMERQMELNNKLAEGQKWRWESMEKK